jgi:hypothetical protein
MKWLVCVVLVLPVVASAGPTKKQLEWTLTNRGDDPDTAVRFGFDSQGLHEGAKTWGEANRDRTDLIELRDPTIATSVDGTAAWAATGARRGAQCAGLTGTIDKCKDSEEPGVERRHAYAPRLRVRRASHAGLGDGRCLVDAQSVHPPEDAEPSASASTYPSSRSSPAAGSSASARTTRSRSSSVRGSVAPR